MNLKHISKGGMANLNKKQKRRLEVEGEASQKNSAKVCPPVDFALFEGFPPHISP